MANNNENNVDNNSLKKENIKRKKDSRLKNSLIIFTCILGGLILVGLVAQSVNLSIFGDTKGYNTDGPYIATVYVEGTISSGQTDVFGLPLGYQHQWTLDKINEFIYDSDNKGLLVFIDSPGGGVYESDELYLKLNEYKEITNRPVYAVMGSMAASGGYYIAAAADKIIANRNTWTGSIGVTIGTLYDISELLDRYGVKTVTITSGENKAMGSSVNPLTKEQQDIFQALIDEAYDQFVGIVAEERNIEIDKARKIADGRIYTAKQALELGLLDKIGTIDDAIYDMSETYDLWECDIVDVIYTDSSFLRSLVGNVKIPDLWGGDVSAVLKIVEGNNKFPISYQCEILN